VVRRSVGNKESDVGHRGIIAEMIWTTREEMRSSPICSPVRASLLLHRYYVGPVHVHCRGIGVEGKGTRCPAWSVQKEGCGSEWTGCHAPCSLKGGGVPGSNVHLVVITRLES
jgi:hypothetical protein